MGWLKSDWNPSKFTHNSFVLRLTFNVSTVKRLQPWNRVTIITNYKAGKKNVPFPYFLSGGPRLCFVIILLPPWLSTVCQSLGWTESAGLPEDGMANLPLWVWFWSRWVDWNQQCCFWWIVSFPVRKPQNEGRLLTWTPGCPGSPRSPFGPWRPWKRRRGRFEKGALVSVLLSYAMFDIIYDKNVSTAALPVRGGVVL